MMVPVILQTSDGQLVSDEEAVLPFRTPPEIIVWGHRFFRLHDPDGGKDKWGRVIPIYREAFTYFITGREKEGVCAPTETPT